MKIGVWHDKLGTLSGGCKCSIDTARALAKEHDITLYSTEKPLLKENWSVSFPHKWIKLPRYKFGGKLWLYKKLLAMVQSNSWVDEDIFISTFGQTITRPQCNKFFQWMYFPFIPAGWKTFYKLYRAPFDSLMNRTLKQVDKLLVFSKYVKRVAHKFYGLPEEQIEVINLSIDVDTFPEPLQEEKTENLVVTTSSYCQWKHLEKVNEIATLRPDFKFYVVGRVTDPNYFNYLRSIKAKNVEYFRDLPNEQVKYMLSRARYYLHVNFNYGKIMDAEHFGIALIEGLAAGCTVLSHNSGGPVEILDKGKYGFLYNDHSEVPQLLGDYIVGPTVSRRRARAYDFSQFRKRLKEVLFN